MTYIKLAWSHESSRFPIEILSELDHERYEVRKIERFRDGRIHIVGPEGAASEDDLAEHPMPSEEVISRQPRLRSLPTSREEFEHIWQSAAISSAA